MVNSIDLFSALATPLSYLIVIAIIVGILKSPWFKGIFGEVIVNLIAKSSLDKDKYHLLKDVTLPTEDGGTTQIDHIIVSTYGVFVIETKNMKGWIFGSEHQKMWTQKIFKQNFKFQNPIHQNYKHLKTLQSLLGLSDDQLHSVVVFIGDITFKTNMPDNVTQSMNYVRYIKSKTEPVIIPKDVHHIIDSIESGRLERSLQTTRKHIKYLKESKQLNPERKTRTRSAK